MPRRVLKTPCDNVAAIVIDDTHIRIRCMERTCPDVIAAKAKGLRVFHIWDLETGKLIGSEHMKRKPTSST